MEATRSAERQGEVAGRTELQQFLTFQLQGELFAVGILNLREIIEFGQLTEVPMMPPCIRGVINLRGRVVPVVDLAARFGRLSTQVARRTSIVIFETGAAHQASMAGAQTPSKSAGDSIGIMVDSVNEVVEIAASDIEPPPDFGAGIHSSFISGMARRSEKFVIVLDVQQVLSMNDLKSLGTVASAADQTAGVTP